MPKAAFCGIGIGKNVPNKATATLNIGIIAHVLFHNSLTIDAV
jgi:hypothetical protein